MPDPLPREALFSCVPAGIFRITSVEGPVGDLEHLVGGGPARTLYSGKTRALARHASDAATGCGPTFPEPASWPRSPRTR